MHMNGDQRLKLSPLYFGQFSRRLLNQDVEKVKEDLIGLLHHLAVVLGVDEGVLRITCPDHLDSKKTNLENGKGWGWKVILVNK